MTERTYTAAQVRLLMRLAHVEGWAQARAAAGSHWGPREALERYERAYGDLLERAGSQDGRDG